VTSRSRIRSSATGYLTRLDAGRVSHLELTWEDEDRARCYRALASFSRLIPFDKRGTGLSDCVAGVADLETRMDDIRAQIDAAGSESATVCWVS
jgi:pimeloyl-ACP methyl ester carboxylesterase